MRIKRAETNVAEADMTPMIDMVFQLVAFFMIVTNFDQQQADERVKLPVDQMVEAVQEARKKELVVNIGFDRNSQGEIISEPKVLLATGDVPVLQYAPIITQEARIALARGGQQELDETTVSIRSDSEVPTGMVQEVVKFAQEAGYHIFAFRALSSDAE